jgi:archaellum component FlaC
MATASCSRCSKSLIAGDFYCRHCGLRLRSWLASRRFFLTTSIILLSVIISGSVTSGVIYAANRYWRGEWADVENARTKVAADFQQLETDSRAVREAQEKQTVTAEALKKQADALAIQLNSFGADTKTLEANAIKVRQIEAELTQARMDLAKATRELEHLRGDVSNVKGEQITTNNGLYEVKADLKGVRAELSKPQSNSRETEAALADALSRLERAEKKLKDLQDTADKAARETAPAIAPVTNGDKEGPRNWMLLTDALSKNERVTQARVREILGAPDSIQDLGATVVWNYKVGRYNSGSVWIERGTLKTVNTPNFK